MTQQDIVDAVNRLSVGYHVSWDDIKIDADKAILKINAYLGTCYPSMSLVLTGPFVSYAVKYKGKYVTIIQDQYIHTIVIPYIASEILARDEEFTTIYNKYSMEVEDGLYTMFSNEFNRVPEMFRQSDTTGVFFADGSHDDEWTQAYDHSIAHNRDLNMRSALPLDVKFTVTYHVNNKNVSLGKEWFYDNTEYNYGDTFTPEAIYTTESAFPDKAFILYSDSGAYAHELVDWYYDPICTRKATGTEIEVTSDIDLYAQWKDYPTLYWDGTRLKLQKNLYGLSYLKIPEYVNGIKVEKLYNTTFKDVTNYIDTLVIPNTVTEVEPYTFANDYGFTGTSIVLPDDNDNNKNTVTLFEEYSLYLHGTNIATANDINNKLILGKACDISYTANTSTSTSYVKATSSFGIVRNSSAKDDEGNYICTGERSGKLYIKFNFSIRNAKTNLINLLGKTVTEVNSMTSYSSLTEYTFDIFDSTSPTTTGDYTQYVVTFTEE